MRLLLAGLLVLGLAPAVTAAELAVLTNDNWGRLAPAGKEADCILGDFALRSDRLLVVVAQPRADRNANMTVRQVGGAVIDLTLVERPNDQLSAFYAGLRRFPFTAAEVVRAKGKSVALAVTAPARPGQPEARVEYELEDGQPFLLVRTVFKNTSDSPLDVPLTDDLRADGFDHKARSGANDLFWVHDEHFEQAYGLIAEGHGLRSRSDVRNSVIEYVPEKADVASVRLAPGRTHTLVRRLIPGPHLPAVKGEARRLRGGAVVPCGWHLVDLAFRPVAGAAVTVRQGDDVYGTARSDAWGWVRADLPPEKFTVTIKAPGRAGCAGENSVSSSPLGSKPCIWSAHCSATIVPFTGGRRRSARIRVSGSHNAACSHSGGR